MDFFRKLSGNKNNTAAVDLPASIASLADKDHEVRKKAIEALTACHYQDPEESRTYRILESVKKPIDQDPDPQKLKADLERYNDFSIAYIRAAHKTARPHDYKHTDVKVLFDGLLKAKTKGDILASLACYYLYSNDDALMTLDYATAAVVMGDPTEGPGDMVDVVTFLIEAFERQGCKKAAKLAKAVKAPYSLSPDDDEYVKCGGVLNVWVRYGKEIQWAAKVVEGKLQSIKDKK